MSVFDKPAGLAASRTVFDRAVPMTPEEQEANAALAYAKNTGAFGQGLTRGVRGLKDNANSFGGTLAEVAGADKLASGLYADAAAQNQLAAAETPDIPELNQVTDFASGARYAAGMMGAGIPYIAPAVATTTGATLMGARPAMAAGLGLASNIPASVGGVQERLRADPVTAAMSPLERAAVAIPEGVAGAALMELAPAAMANRLRAGVKTHSVPGAIAEDVATEAASGVGTELLAQNVQSALNPLRDTTNDSQQLFEAGLGDALGVAPFAVPHAFAGATRDKVVSEPRDWIQERIARSQDADYNAVNNAQTMPKGTTDKHAWLQQDDEIRNQAAERLAQRYASDKEAPDTLRAAAEKFMNGPKTGDAWKEMYSAAKHDQRVSDIKAGLESFGKSFRQRVKNGVEAAKAARENAQTPLVDNTFDSLLADSIFAHTGLDNSDVILDTLPQTVTGMKTWITNGFAIKQGGEVHVPGGIEQAFRDPAAAIQDAYSLMTKQGLVKKDPERLAEVLSQLKVYTEAKKADGALIEDNLLPTAQAEHKFSGADHEAIAREVRRMVATGKINDKVLDSLFGPNKEVVLAALAKEADKQQDVGTDAEEAIEGSGLSDDLEYSEKQTQEEYAPTVEYHGPYTDSEGAAEHASKLEEKLTNTHGRVVSRMGVVDMLREKYADNPAKFAEALTDYIAKHSKDLTTDAEKARPEDALNAKHFVLRSEDAGDKRSALDIEGRELNSITPGSVGNVWAEPTGAKGEYGTIAHGKLIFERLSYDGKGEVDKETGEIGPSAKQFTTSTNKLIARIRRAKQAGEYTGEAVGTAEQYDMLRAGIASMLAAKDIDGRPVVSGRIGVVDEVGKPVRWLKPTDELPKALRLPSGATLADVETKKDRPAPTTAEEVRAYIEEVIARAEEMGYEAQASKLEEAFWDVYGEKGWETKLSEPLKLAKDLDQLIAHAGRAEASDTDPMLPRKGHTLETLRGQSGTKPRVKDETTGEVVQPIHTRAEKEKFKRQEETPELGATEEQKAYVLKELEKGVPSFNAMLDKLSAERAAKVAQTLREIYPTLSEALQRRADVVLAKVVAPITKPSEQRTEPVSTLKKKEKDDIRADIVKRLGPDIAVEFAEKILGSKGAEISGEWQEGLIRISMWARDPAQVGSHEAMHEFFNRLIKSGTASAKVLTVLTNAANSASVVRQLERLLVDEPAALRQIKEGAPHAAEERLAYMYQFWHAGLLTIGPETKTFFGKVADFIRSVVGKLTDEQKAEQLLQAFDRGETQTADAAVRVLANNIEHRERVINAAYKVIEPAVDKLARFTLPSESILMSSGNPHLKGLLRDFKNPTGEGVAQSYIEAKSQKIAQFTNDYEKIVGKYQPKDLDMAHRALREGVRPTDRVAREIYDGVRKLFDSMETYMREAGIKTYNEETGKWENFGHIINYFPRAYDVSAIAKNPAEFIAALIEHHSPELEAIAKKAMKERDSKADVPDTYASAVAEKSGEAITIEEVAMAITNRIIMSYGQPDISESSTDVGYSPAARAINKRTLHWLDVSKFHKWMNNDLSLIVTTYAAQGTKRAEYVRRFGNSGERISDAMTKAYEFEKERIATKDPELSAEKVEEQALKTLEGPAKAVMALEGTLGYDIDPRNRRIQGTIVAYENMRTLAMSLFSSVVDPLGIMVRGGELQDAMAAFSRGLKEIWASWKGEHTDDKAAQIAEMIGTVDASGFLAMFGQAQSSVYLSERLRKWNEALFKWNGMEGFNRGIRIQATQAAISFIKRQVTHPDEHSKRYLDELLLTADDIKINNEGDINYENPKIQVAIKRWVDGAILRPNAAHRPIWMSDPHWQVFSHMKQFSYTFHDTIIKRAWTEMQHHKNLGPLGILLGAYTPVMVASDAAKAILLTGKEPVWMQGGLPSIIDHGARRAGLLGIAQPYADPMLSGHPASMAGPAVDQLVSAVTQPFDETLVDALPGASVVHTISGRPTANVIADD